jgi:hypothetical protein
MTDPTSEYIRAQELALEAALAFIGTVAGGAAWWDDVWEDHRASLDAKRDAWESAEKGLEGENS